MISITNNNVLTVGDQNQTLFDIRASKLKIDSPIVWISMAPAILD